MFRQRFQNFLASLLFVGIAFSGYRFSPHSAGLRAIWNDQLGVSGRAVLEFGSIAYCTFLLAFYFFEPHPTESKSLYAFRALRRWATAPVQTFRGGLSFIERLGLLSVLLKGFFAPLMVLSLFDFTGTMINNGIAVYQRFPELGDNFLDVFNTNGYWFLFQLILFADVLFFTFGYLIELPALKNEIRSVDPTWMGWFVTLICYPPMNGITSKVLGGNTSTFPQFENAVAHMTLNGLLLVLMAIYASASAALNFKGSNLTHRGIISHGPYRFVRHPAYVCKNLAWWIGTIPAILAAWTLSVWDALLVVVSAAAWSAVYTLRALTEEDHLRKVDDSYDLYCQKVPYRFIPGLW